MVLKDSLYRKWLQASIIIIYLIIIAGAVVRMTGSGMGCPDWPKCFGYWVPPTEISALEFSPNTSYKKGMVIIVDEELRVAKEDFKTNAIYQESNWTQYEKHDYAIFNKYHTWTEYINRLIGALGGLVVLIMAIIATIVYRKKKARIVTLSFVAFLSMMIQAVIGKIVVDTVLHPVLITIHMVVALLIVGLLIYLLHEVTPIDHRYQSNKKMIQFSLLLIILTLIQVATGTQVRQFLDHKIDVLGHPFLSNWLEKNSPLVFLIHRSYSILLTALHIWFIYKVIRVFKHPRVWYQWLIALLIITIGSGICMNYLDFPLGSQALHLVIASMILGVQFYIWIQLRKTLI